MNNKKIATIRTALPAGWATIVLWALAKLGVNLTADDIVILAPGAVLVVGVLYGIFRELEARWPWLGRIFLGVNRVPQYPDEIDANALVIASIMRAIKKPSD